MKTKASLEYWLRGPVSGIPPLLQPVAHALLQAREEVNEMMAEFPDELLWDRPGGVASPGFHLRHLTGVLDRLFTYARGEGLSEGQLAYLAAEGKSGVGMPRADVAPDAGGAAELVERFNDQIDKSLEELRSVLEASLTEPRMVGRGRAPSTVGGLLFHAAEHTQRHVGQLLVTIRVLGQNVG